MVSCAICRQVDVGYIRMVAGCPDITFTDTTISHSGKKDRMVAEQVTASQ